MTESQFNKLNEKQDEFIELLHNRLKKRLKSLAKDLFKVLEKEILSKLESDDNGIMLNDNNIALINNIPKLFKGIKLGRFIRDTKADYLLVIEKTSPYFEAFKLEADRIKQIKERLIIAMEQRINNITSKITVGRSKALQGKKWILTEMAKGRTFTELRKSVINYVFTTGTPFNHINTELQDTFMEGNRFVVDEMAKGLNLDNYYRYTGGLVQKSRDFCESKNRKVFTKYQVEQWSNQTWQGKSVPYNPFINVGGYNCRHRLMPISEDMFYRLKNQGF